MSGFDVASFVVLLGFIALAVDVTAAIKEFQEDLRRYVRRHHGGELTITIKAETESFRRDAEEVKQLLDEIAEGGERAASVIATVKPESPNA